MLEPDVFTRDYAGRSAMAPHEHQAPSLSIVIRGGFSERIGGQDRTYERDHAAFCPAGMTHAQTFGRDGARQIVINTRPEWLEYLSDCKLALDDAPYMRSPWFGDAARRLLAELSRADPFSRLSREGLVLEIVAAFGRGWVEQSSVRPPVWLAIAEEFIRANALRNISLDTVASAAGRHPIHLCREFRRHFGVSVAGYVRRVRIQEATDMIRTGEMSLSEIALECGFSSHAHLCREFKRQLGMKPSEYRLATCAA
jgi:AraC family transcriptional regulator